jgi:hypothetical protein
LTVNGTLPLEVKVTDFVTAVPTETSPNCKEEVLRLRAAAEAFDAFSCIKTVRDAPFAVAEMVAVCVLPTAATFAVNDAVAERAGTTALAGTATALLVLARVTVRALDEVALSDTVHAVFPAPVNDVFAQENDFTSGVPTAAVGGEREMERDFTALPWVAVITPVWSALTFETVATNLTLLAPAGTVTEAGTLIAEVLLESCTWSPLDGAATFVTIVQESEAAPVTLASSQVNPFISAEAEEPLPCNLIVVAGVDEALVITPSWSDESELLLGEKWTVRLMVLPDGSVTGNFPTPSTRKAALERDNCEIWTESAPLFAREIFWFAELPIPTFPKSIVAGVAARLGASVVFGPEDPPSATTPPHPETPKAVTLAKRRESKTEWLKARLWQEWNDCFRTILRTGAGRVLITYILTSP